MEGNNRKRPPKKVENPFREWVSDNLRYILLILVIAAAALVVFFIIRGVTGHGQRGQEEPPVRISSVSEPVTSSSSVTTDSGQTVPEGREETGGMTEAGEDVRLLTENYFKALYANDTQAVAAMVDHLSEQEINEIASSVYPESFSGMKVYVYPGEAEKEYVVLAAYDYKLSNFETKVPALTQLYIYDRGDGRLVVASDATEARKQQIMQQTLTKSEAVQLINEVKARYDAALENDPALAGFLAGSE